MTPERWRQIEAIFEACLDRPPAERDALLAARCDGDEALRGEVEALLDAESLVGCEPDARLEGLVESSCRAALAGPPSGRHRAGEVVGAYRLEHCLGEGGMGSVWQARRIGEDFEQQVAIKFVGAAAPGRGFEGRFRIERQILARLDHPHIARLLGGGSTRTGEPYLVMERVRGEQLLDYCRENRLEVQEKLRLFLQVASAVEHAHRHLVVHRDLKPANILVHAETGPKLLDFGIAKLLLPAEQLDSTGVDVTRPEDRLLTPDYASPEQVIGHPVTTASDIYSLGVVLCEMLTGERPHRLEGLTPSERERRLTETAPRRPSTLVLCRAGARPPAEARALARRLRGDLDTIVQRALDPEPGRRYSSVHDLAADVDRHLRGEPVSARRDGWTYRVGKWLRRHPWGAAALLSISLLLFALFAGLVLHSRQLEAERDRALAARSQARTVSDFLMHLFEVSDPSQSRGETVTARELLDRGADEIAKGLEDEPEVQAALLATLADVHVNLGLYRRGVSLQRLALERRAEHLGPHHPDTAHSHDRLGDSLRQLGEIDDAERHLRRALEIRRGEPTPELATTLNNLGLLLLERGQHAAAEPMLRRGLAIREATLGHEHPDTVVSRSNVGQLLLATGRLDEASERLESVLASRIARHGEKHPKVAVSLHTLGSLRHQQGRLEQAEPLFGRALELRRQLLPADHPHLASSLNNMASVLHDQLRLGDAETFYRQSIAVDRAGVGQDSVQHAHTLNNLASLLEELGRFDEAEPLYRRSLEMRLAAYGVSRSSERLRSKLGRLLLLAGRPGEAAPLIEEAHAWSEQHLAAGELDRLRSLERLALLRRAEGEPEQAIRLLERARDAASVAIAEDHQVHPRLDAELASTFAASAAPERCRAAVARARARPGFEHSSVAVRGRVELAAGLCARATGRPREATAALEAALEGLRPVFGERNAWVREAKDALEGLRAQ